MSDQLFQNEITNNWKYDLETNLFICDDFSYKPVIDIMSEYQLQDFEIYLLHNEKLLGENCIYQVYFDEQRVGWIFPTQATLSSDHDYAENQHFLKYAYVGILWMLQHINLSYYSGGLEEFEFPDEVTNYVLLMIDRRNLSGLKDYKIENYIVDLFQKGYTFEGNGNLISEVIHPDKSIRLKRISDQIQDLSVLCSFFRGFLTQEMDNITCFHMLYQLVEMLIERVFIAEFRKIVDDLNANQANLFEKREELNTLANEKRRVIKLFNNYAIGISSEKRNALEDICSKILAENSKKEPKSMAEALYDVRCLIVHQFYTLNAQSIEKLKGLNSAFLDVIFDVLICYKEPSTQISECG